jgi:DinB family protein
MQRDSCRSERNIEISTMRKATLASLLVLCATAAPLGSEMTQMERQRLLAHMEMTATWLIDEVSNLSRDQIEFRHAPGSWNILEVVEHLVMVGPIYWEDLQKALKTPASARLPSNRDEDILWYGIDRTHREMALSTETPKGQLRDLKAGLESYRKQHARLVEYIRTTKDDLRSHIVERQGSDAYQWALLISTHEQRHILQIREIKADPKFPRK